MKYTYKNGGKTVTTKPVSNAYMLQLVQSQLEKSNSKNVSVTITIKD